LVSNTRIGEIKKGFYEFQFTKEMFKHVAPSGNQTGIAIRDQETGEQGTPKRQRINATHDGDGPHSAPPTMPLNNESPNDCCSH
jgi:hypothetical protein